ncbi:galactitol-1-phosphate 5-dehydrogenase [Eubacteriales bacterium OttesenSCG-928-N13]|nr:galactitol-1-phosphate 5-dehydrogenase [Eubacteriales bacterium OttesenSCG-928-N13]
MKALVLEEYGRFVFQDFHTPTAGKGEVIVKVEVCSVCGSDVHGMDGSTGRRIPPIVMGHEASGTIAALGEGVEGHSVGERVTFDSTAYCGECYYCKTGRVNLCTNRRVFGVSCGEYRMHGAFAEYVAVPERLLYPLPDGVSFVEAAMVEPLSVAYHAATRAPVQGKSCVVIGAGTIGTLLIQVLRALGASQVIAVDIDPGKLDFATHCGADMAISSRDPDVVARILSYTGEGADLAFDATGIQATFSMALDITRKGGDVVLVGNLAPKVELMLQSVVTRELTLHGSCASAGEYPECLALIAQRKVDVLPLVSKCVPLSEGNEWIHRVHRGEDGLSKIVLMMNGGNL